jgi:hypothetical protein
MMDAEGLSVKHNDAIAKIASLLRRLSQVLHSLRN